MALAAALKPKARQGLDYHHVRYKSYQKNIVRYPNLDKAANSIYAAPDTLYLCNPI